ncbi:MAG: TIGR03618 family F420-dependent PPOX class oxidoreductase [Chloroflexi bacterium]|nr:TIGR03618 family F420-dependent PPOX class oxidoreductase [Chloroflexota bacterium]MCL5275756.1 TIGR03618 family F420-dependent PPOX class oxidoreductase [Chloroflexota bacterium]
MTVSIPERYTDLLGREKKAFAYLALVRSDGSPQVTPIWFDFDGAHFIFNTARGRVKDRIMHRHPKVAFVITDPDNPYRYMQVNGQIEDETEEGAADMIRSLNVKYHGNPNYNIPPGQVRVTYKVLAERISTM